MSIAQLESHPSAYGILDFIAGRFYNSQHVCVLGTQVVTADVLRASPLWVTRAVTVTDLSLDITTGAAGSARLGIYLDSLTVPGTPGALVADGGAFSTTLGVKTSTVNAALVPGLYWLASVFSGAPTVRSLSNAAGDVLVTMGFTSNLDTTLHVGVSVAFTFAALPDPFTAGSVLAATHIPCVRVTL